MKPGASVTVLCSFSNIKGKYKESYNQQATSHLLTLNSDILCTEISKEWPVVPAECDVSQTIFQEFELSFHK